MTRTWFAATATLLMLSGLSVSAGAAEETTTTTTTIERTIPAPPPVTTTTEDRTLPNGAVLHRETVTTDPAIDPATGATTTRKTTETTVVR